MTPNCRQSAWISVATDQIDFFRGEFSRVHPFTVTMCIHSECEGITVVVGNQNFPFLFNRSYGATPELLLSCVPGHYPPHRNIELKGPYDPTQRLSVDHTAHHCCER